MDSKPLGNSPFANFKGKAGNKPGPRGPYEPKRLNVKKRVLNKWQTHPVDKMVKIANFVEATNPDLAAKIWMRILDSCELEEKQKKGFLPPVSAVSASDAEAEALRQLEEIEKDEPVNPQSDSDGLENGPIDLQVEAGSEENLSVDSGV